MKINFPLLKIKIKVFFNLATEAEKAAVEEAFIRSQKEAMKRVEDLCKHQIYISDDIIDANTQQMQDGSYLIGADTSPESDWHDFWKELWQTVNIFQSTHERSLHRWIFRYNHSAFVSEIKSLGYGLLEILFMFVLGGCICLLVCCLVV